MPNVICLGELLIDLCAAEQDVTLAEARTFTKAPGLDCAAVELIVQSDARSGGSRVRQGRCGESRVY